MSHRCERAMLLLLHETSQGTFSHVFDRDSTDLDDIEKDIGEYSSKGKRNVMLMKMRLFSVSQLEDTVLFESLCFNFKNLIYFFVCQ